MARGKRGGQRTPRNPAPVSGPGALSQRTDGGPSRPPVIANEQGYGVRGQTEAAASSAPMYADQANSPAPAPPQTPIALGALPQAFGPSQRPGPPPVSSSPPRAQDVLRAVYEAYPSPWIASLLHDDL
jgi:hypothetical protein